MKIKLSNLLILLLLVFFSFSALLLLILGFLKFSQLLFIFDKWLHIDYNESTRQYIRYFQIRSLYSGVFLSGITFFFFFYRAKLEILLATVFSSFKEIFQQLKGIFKRQISGKNLKYTIGLSAILLFSILVRIQFIHSPIRYDEGFTYYYYSKKPFFLLLSYYDYPNNHIFHTFLVKISTLLFGDSVISLRLTAFVFGIFLIPLVYIYTGKYFQKNAAILAAAFTSVSSILICYSVNARGYTLNYCAFIVLLVLAESLRKRNNLFLWGLFICIQIIGIYTIPTMIYASLIVYLYLMLSFVFVKVEKSPVSIKQIILSIIVIGITSVLLYLPVYLLMGGKAIVANNVVQSQSYEFVFSNLLQSLRDMYKMFTVDIPIIIQLFLFIGIIISIVIFKQCRYLFYSIILLLLFVFFVQRVVPFPRVFVFLFPLFFIFSAIGIVYLIDLIIKTKQYVIVLVISISLISILSFLTFKSNSPTEKFDVSPIKSHHPVFIDLKKSVSKNDRVLCWFPLESSVKSYFYFNEIPQSSLTNNPFHSKKVFIIVGERFLQETDTILYKNKVDSRLFRRRFYLESKKEYSDHTVIYEYRENKMH